MWFFVVAVDRIKMFPNWISIQIHCSTRISSEHVVYFCGTDSVEENDEWSEEISCSKVTSNLICVCVCRRNETWIEAMKWTTLCWSYKQVIGGSNVDSWVIQLVHQPRFTFFINFNHSPWIFKIAEAWDRLLYRIYEIFCMKITWFLLNVSEWMQAHAPTLSDHIFSLWFSVDKRPQWLLV